MRIRTGPLPGVICFLQLALALAVNAGDLKVAPRYPAGPSPQSIATGDFNGDGKLDLAVADRNSNSVSILLGNGDGTFQPPVSYSVDLAPVFVVVGDFNGDGKLDLAVVNAGSNDVSILLGNGDGTFQPAVSYSVGRNPQSVTVGDWNGDGKLDLAVANQGDNDVTILLGNGDGTFQPPSSYAVGTSPVSVTAGDFNGDGHLDLAVANQGDNDVAILLGNGDGTFQPPSSYIVGTSPVFVTAGDFNGDGHLDLAVANQSDNDVSILLGNGDGTFQAAANFAVGTAPISLVTGDFNGDGKLDIAAANQNGNDVSILLGNGDGTFQGTLISYSVGNSPASLAVGDFNSDGSLDLAAANQGSNDVSILLGSGAGTFPAAAIDYNSGKMPISIAVADFNGDGHPDLVVVNESDNDVSILLGKGDGTFQAAASYAAGTGPVSVAVGDFNGDGKLDLAVVDSGSNNVSILLGNGDGTFQPAMSYSVGNNPQSVAVGDFNGDGRLDLAVANGGDNNVSILLGNGDGTFQPAMNYSVGNNPQFVAVGDFNADGHLDLAVANGGDNNVGILLGNGDGTFQAPVNYPAGSNPQSVAVGDFNADGHLDLAVANQGSNNVDIFLGNGDGTFQPGVSYGADLGPSSVVTGDFNGDGRLDLAVANASGSDASVLLGNGDGTFATAVNYGTGKNPKSIATGDFNGDGSPDIAAANSSGNNVTILLNAHAFAVTATTLSTSANPSAYEQSLILTAAIASTNGTPSSGTVNFLDGATVLSTVPVSNGHAAFSTPALSPGTHVLSAQYSGGSGPGNIVFVPSASSPVSQVVNMAGTTTSVTSAPNPSQFGQTVTLTATVMPTFGGTPTGSVTFLDGTQQLGQANIGNGVATLATASLGAGTHTIQASYSGDSNFLPSSATAAQTVNMAGTTTNVTATPNPSQFGQTVTMTATVMPVFGGTPTGSVTFLDGTLQLGSAGVSGGVAMLTISSLAAGTHNIQAAYSGDSNFLPSSAAVSQTVKMDPTATSISSNPNPSPVGQPVSFTAVVSSVPAGIPTGTVTFEDGATVLGTVALAGAQASLTTSALKAGQHTISANYSGDPNYLPSAASLSQTVIVVATTWTKEPVSAKPFSQWPAYRGWNKLVFEPPTGAILLFGANNECENLFVNGLYAYNPVANTFSRRTWSGSREIGGVEGKCAAEKVYNSTGSHFTDYGCGPAPCPVPATHPGDRHPYWQAAYDSTRNRLWQLAGAEDHTNCAGTGPGVCSYQDTFYYSTNTAQQPAGTGWVLTCDESPHPPNPLTPCISSPGPRQEGTMDYDPDDDIVMLYGGLSGGGEAGDVWFLTPTTGTWTDVCGNRNNLCVGGPGPRAGNGLVYIGKHKFLLFGGYTKRPGCVQAAAFNDTWVYNVSNHTWTNMNPSSAPPTLSPCTKATPQSYPRYPMITYDSKRNVVWYHTGNPTDTQMDWRYDVAGNAWTLEPFTGGPKWGSPSSENSISIVYDSALDALIGKGGPANGATVIFQIPLFGVQ